MVSFLAVFIFLRAFTFYALSLFLDIFIFLRAFVFARCFKFFTYFTCLHFFACLRFFIFSSQMPSNRRKGGNCLVFIFFLNFTGVIRIYFGLLNLETIFSLNTICSSKWTTSSQEFRKNSDTSFIKDLRVSALITFFKGLMCTYLLLVSSFIMHFTYLPVKAHTLIFHVPYVFIFYSIFTCPTSTS